MTCKNSLNTAFLTRRRRRIIIFRRCTTAVVMFILCNDAILSAITTHTRLTHFYTASSHKAETQRYIITRTSVENRLPLRKFSPLMTFSSSKWPTYIRGSVRRRIYNTQVQFPSFYSPINTVQHQLY